MSCRESLSLPPDCSLRKEFPEGEVYVQTSGSENYGGPTHVILYDTPWESVPRMPIMHLNVPMGGSADFHVEAALKVEHDDTLSDSACGCIALDALGFVMQRHKERVDMVL